MASPKFDSKDFQASIVKKYASSPLSSPSSISTTSTNSKQRSITGSSNNNDETITTIKMEDGNDEVKVFSASTIKKNEPDDDIDVDGIEDRLSPVVEEPVSRNKSYDKNRNLLCSRQAQIKTMHSIAVFQDYIHRHFFIHIFIQCFIHI